MPEAISDTIRNAIRRDPRSQTQLGVDSGVDAAVISRLVHSKRSPGLDSVDLLCRALRLELRAVPKKNPQRRKARKR